MHMNEVDTADMMDAAIFARKGVFEIDTVSIPTPGHMQILVKVSHSCVCGSDVHRAFISGEAEPGVVLGHEFSGTVCQIGEGVTKFKVGDRVVSGGVELQSNEAEARITRPTNPAHPWDRRFSPRMNGRQGAPGTIDQGGFAQFVLLRESGAFLLPANVTNREGALTEPTAVAVHAVRKSGILLGDVAVVIGLGPIGLLVGHCARLAGASKVIGLDLSPARRLAAEAMGFDHVIDPQDIDDPVKTVVEKTNGNGAEVVFECAGAPATLEQALMMAAKNGKVVLVALCWKPAPILPVDWIGREVEMVTTYAYGEKGWDIALSLLERKLIPCEVIVPAEAEYPLTNIQSAFEQCVRPSSILKPMLIP